MLMTKSYFAGFDEVANFYLGKFKWGKSFLEVNKEILEKYKLCRSSIEVVAAQDNYLKEQVLLRQQRRGLYLLYKKEYGKCFI